MVIISGMGELSFKSGCAIVLQDGSKLHSPMHHRTTAMDDLHLYNLIQQYPVNTNITIPIPDIMEIPLTHLSINNLTIPEWDQFRAETLFPLRSLPFLARALLFTTTVTILLFILWCTCRKCKHG